MKSTIERVQHSPGFWEMHGGAVIIMIVASLKASGLKEAPARPKAQGGHRLPPEARAPDIHRYSLSARGEGSRVATGKIGRLTGCNAQNCALVVDSSCMQWLHCDQIESVCLTRTVCIVPLAGAFGSSRFQCQRSNNYPNIMQYPGILVISCHPTSIGASQF